MKKGLKFKIFFGILIFAAALFWTGGESKTVQAASKKYTVKFVNPAGKISTKWYRQWTNQYKNGVKSGTTITLPTFNSKDSKNFWVVKTSSGEKRYNHGAKVKITQNTVFYMKYCKYYTVKFYTPSGSGEFKQLRVKAYDTQYITLPKSPAKDNTTRRSFGWLTAKGSGKQYSFGASVKITGDVTKFYLKTQFYSKSKVNLYYTGGNLYSTVDNSSGTATFPEVATSSANMILGWSRTQGKHTNPDYYPGDKIPSKNGKFYMVKFTAADESRTTTSKIPSRYSSVYFVGDSRTAQIQWAVNNGKISVAPNIDFVCERGKGLGWFKSEGSKLLENKLKSNDTKSDQIAIVFNLGVNDLSYASQYVTYYKEYANRLKSDLGYKNIKLYYMSVNPINYSMIVRCLGSSTRTVAAVESFNRIIKAGLCQGSNAAYTYIDCYSYLRKNGWISNRYNYGYYDGLHYSIETGARIYNYCIDNFLCK